MLMNEKDKHRYPLGAEKRMAELKEKKEKLISELETQIKVSNATTVIEF